MKKLKLIVILMCFFTLMFPVGLAQDLINNPQEYEDRIMDAASSLGLTFEELQYITLRIREITSVYESGDEIRAVNQLVQISEQYPDLGVISACEGIFQDYYATFEEKGERHYVHASLDKVFSESTDIAEGMGSYMGGSVQQTLYNIDDWWNIDEARDIVIEMIITHYPNATIDNEVIECIQIGKNSEGKMEAFFPIITTDEIVPGERIIPVRTCIYADRTDSHIADVHLEDTTNLIYDKSGYNGKESLYSLGEFILINGNNCKHTERYYKICTGHKITEYVVKTEKVKHKVSVKVTNMESKEHVIKGWIITNREYGSGLLGMPKQIINGKVVCGIEHSYGDYNKGFLHCGCIIVAEECTDCDIEKARTNPECGCRVGKIVNKMPQIVVCSCLDGGEKICGKDGNPECTEGPEDESEIIDKIESTDEISCGNQKTTGYGGRNYPVKVDFKGFKILCEDNDDDNSKTINSKEFAGDGWINAIPENKVWRTMGTIVDIEDAEYDPDKGTFYGEIIATCDCCKDCTWSRRLYFGDLETETFYNLTVKVTPNTSGTVKVTGYMDTDGDGKSEDKKQTVTITNQKTMRVKAGSNYNIVSTAGNGYEFRHLVTAAGNKITTSDDYDYVMPPMDTTIVAHFVPSPANGYTLYVNSNEGGRGYTEDRPSGTEYTTTIAENGTASIITEKITGVKSGTEFTLKYEAEDGYEFSRWEYRPFVEETYLVSTKDSKIKMPASDLVATAIFVKKSPVINETNPILTVTVNNESWGTAYALVDGVPTTLSEVVPGTEYQIVFDANDGYYFTNWVYDSVESPFVDGENGIIVMPPHDLEITGLFAPLPPPDEENRNSSVKFVAETTTPEDKIVPGTVPENLPEVAHGAEVTLGVTANTGYEFVKWYITDTNNNKLTPDLTYNDFGSGIFIMPMQDVIAHAVFKKVDKSNLTIKIIGEGSVTADGNDVPNGGIVTVTTGDTTKLIATPEDGSKFLYWMDEDGNIISYDEELNYTVNGDTVIYAVFAEKKYYTLYISSMNGGEAYTFGNENHPEESIIKITDALGKTVYKIENVMEGERFTIYYDVDSGFTFDKWEYKPYIIAEDEVRNYRRKYRDIDASK